MSPMRISSFVVLLVLNIGTNTRAFAPRHDAGVSSSSSSRTRTLPLFVASQDAKAARNNAAADDFSSTNPINGLILQKDVKSQLFASFSALGLSDQYDAVLTGLCAKIVDNEQESINLANPLQLLQEMNDKRLVASPRSIMALIDATAKAQDAFTMANVMSLCTRNGGITAYGSCLNDIQALPVTPQTRVRCPDGSIKTRQERLDSVATIPVDERSGEVGAALATAAIATTCEMTDLVPGLSDVSPMAHLVLTGMITVGVLDNCYDLVQSATNLAVSQLGKDNELIRNIQLPDKDSLPLGLGSGQATGQVVRGATRLLTIDPAREAQTEASALFVAYALGLPVFSFRANALEASVMAVDNRDELLSDTGILRLLMWLLAPVAAESARYPILVSSDPREAYGFLDRLEQVAANDMDVAEALWWIDNPSERNDLLQWAYTEADVLLRDNRKVVQELAERLEGGAATIGDCIAVLEEW